MQLLLIRHGIAEDAERFAESGGSDDQRPLTEIGRKKMRKGASRLRSQLTGIDLLASSPLLRAKQTAEIVAAAFGGLAIQEQAELSPEGSLDALLDWLRAMPETHTVALVGHDPHLNLLAGAVLLGTPREMLNLKKGGAVLIGFEGRAVPGTGLLHWLLTPAQLRGLSG